MNDIFKNNAFKDIDPTFLKKVEDTIASTQGKSDLEVIGTLMALSNEANERGIQMTNEQQKILIQHLRNSLPMEKRQKFDFIISMMSN